MSFFEKMKKCQVPKNHTVQKNQKKKNSPVKNAFLSVIYFATIIHSWRD